MDKQTMKSRFDAYFKDAEAYEKEPRYFYAPGRVNLIGEHTDYNGGYVFPCALNLGVYGAARRRKDNQIRLVSGNMKDTINISLEDMAYNPAHGWANYPKGVIAGFLKGGYHLGGFDLYMESEVPIEAGLSSSAAVELLTAVILNAFFNCGMSKTDMIKLSQQAENSYVGVNCGIMDQFAVGMGKKGHAILLDCEHLQYQYAPLALDGYTLVIANTNKPRGLADSKYNERRSECNQALALLQTECEVSCLCALTPEAFEAHKHVIKDTILQNRAVHAVYENARTLAAVKSLGEGDIAAFGQLMNESHKSLRDLYAVTGPELDALAEAAWQTEGVIGSRMTGAGFGGCTVSIVRADAAQSFIEAVGFVYKKQTGLQADFYAAETGDGADEI